MHFRSSLHIRKRPSPSKQGLDQKQESLDQGRLQGYTKRVEPVMLFLAVSSVPLFLLEHRFWQAAAVGWVVVAAFLVDLVVRVVLVDGSRLRYLIRHWPDVVIVVLSLLPIARPLRALRALQMIRGVRALVAAHKAATALTEGWSGMRGKALIVMSAVLSVVAVITVYEAERIDGGSINSLEDALWWAASTVTTVGYGDLSPATTVARVAAVVLMICGVSLFGLLTANISAKFLKNDAVLAYEELAELVGTDRPCPNCGYTATMSTSAADEAADENASSDKK